MTDINGETPLEAAVFSDDEKLLAILHLITSDLKKIHDEKVYPRIELET